MSSFWIRRLWHSMITLFTMLTLMFFMFRLLPGDPTATVISPALYPKAQEALKIQFGLDKPLWQQYFSYLSNLASFDFGLSFHTGRPVSEEIGGRLINTILLVFPSMIAAYALGSYAGAIIGWRRGSKLETIMVFLSTSLQSAPVFWLSMIAILFFSINLDLFPVGHIVTPGMFPDEDWRMYFSLDFLHHLALPFLINTIYNFCFPFLLMRSSILSTVGEEYIELARMKGLTEKAVLYRHAMLNSMLPLATTLPMTLSGAVAGSVVVETVFSWPGLGLLMVEAVGHSDFPMVQAAFLLIAVLTVVGTLLADFLYSVLDPRIVNQ